MAETLEMQAAPKPQFLELGLIKLKFEGNVEDSQAEVWANQYVFLLNAAINKDVEYSFDLNGNVIFLSNVSVEFEKTEKGSIIARARIVAQFLVGTYASIAAYPSFKEALPVIRDDIAYAFTFVSTNAPEQDKNLPAAISMEIILRDENDIEAEMDQTHNKFKR